jgi:hypothetical protein
MYAKHSFRIAAILPLLTLTGCVTQSDSGQSVTFHHEWWVWAGIIAVGLIFMPIGLGLLKSDRRLAFGMILMGPLAILGLAPTYFREHVTVDDQGVETRHGFWGLSSANSVQFADAAKLRSGPQAGRRGKMHEVLYFDLKDGSVVPIHISGDMLRQARQEIIRRAKAAGIPSTAPEQPPEF